MEQLSLFNLIAHEGEYVRQRMPSGSIYYTCAKCGELVRIDIGEHHMKLSDEERTIYKKDICSCGAVIKY